MGELVGKAIQAHATQNDPTKTSSGGSVPESAMLGTAAPAESSMTPPADVSQAAQAQPAGATITTPAFADPGKEMFAEAWDAAKDVHEVNKKARSEEGKKLKEVSLPAVEAPDMSIPQETSVDHSPARSEDADAKLKALMAQIQGS
ncbi:MAG: hypothetical protein WCT05_15750 [Lentisphaeria bacterium]